MNEQNNIFIVIGQWLQKRQNDKNPPKTIDVWQKWLPTPGNILFTLVGIAILIGTQSVWARPTQSPTGSSTSTISYQGRLVNAEGNPITDLVSMEFRIYSVPSGGTFLWEEYWTGNNAVNVSDGLFHVMLGSFDTTLPSAIAGHDELYLGITVGTDTEMLPRIQLGSVPFSMQAMTVPDGSITGSKLANDAVTGEKILDGQISSSDVNFNFAGSTSLGGPASDLECTDCVSGSEIQNGQVSSADVDFNYAGSASKGGAANVANDLSCTNCVSSGEIQDGQVSSSDVSFNYAGSSSKGGAADNLTCSNCISTGEIQNGQVGTGDLANNAVTSEKIQDGAVTQAEAPSLVKSSNGNSQKIQYGSGTISSSKCNGTGYYCTDITLPEAFQNSSYKVVVTGEKRFDFLVINKTTTGFRVRSDIQGYHDFDWIAIGK